jgi:hypothetical protein
MIRREVDGKTTCLRIGYYGGEFLIVIDDEKCAYVRGEEVVEIEIDQEYFEDVMAVHEIQGFDDKDERGQYVYDKNGAGFRELTEKYFIDKVFYDGISTVCDDLSIDTNHAQNLMVPLSDIIMTKKPDHSALYREGYGKQAKQLVDLLLRLKYPGVEPDPSRTGDKKRDYYPEIKAIRIETGFLKTIGAKSKRKKIEKEDSYNFTHDRIILLFRELLGKWSNTPQFNQQIERLKNWKPAVTEADYILVIYEYLVYHGLCNPGKARVSGSVINNDASKKTGYLIETAKKLRGMPNRASELPPFSEYRLSQDVADRYRHAVKSAYERLESNQG